MMKTRNLVVNACLLVFAGILIVGGCANLTGSGQPVAKSDVFPGALVGYLQPDEHPDSSVLLPPPPAPGSSAFALDEDVNRKCLALRGTPRWELAAMDADLTFPHAAGTFSCVLNAPITQKDTPRLYTLLRRICTDEYYSDRTAKNRYKRVRPFVTNGKPTCTPKDEAFLRRNGSYPSGHTAIGWAWALVLSEISPGQADAILKRGRAFGQSRLVCNVHWYSDVIEGSFMGAAIVARLQADSTFRADLEAAKAELAAVRAKGLKPVRDCKAEAEALACPLD